MDYPIEKIRSDFPIFAHQGPSFAYLDTAATAQKPICVIRAISDFYEYEYATVHRAIYNLSAKATDRYGEVRKALQRFINAEKEEEIVFVRSTTEAINLVAFSFGERFLEEGDEVVISALEHHANIVPWQLLAQRKNIRLKIIPVDDAGALDLDEARRLITSRTKLVSIAHVTNTTGSLFPIREIAAIAHERGAKVLVDGAQAAGHIPIDVQMLDVDFYAFSAHKMYGPTGVGVLYGKEKLLEAMPPFQGGGDMVDRVSFEKSTFQPAPLKFEPGTPPIAEVIGWGAAIDYINQIGIPQIEEWEKALSTKVLEVLREIPEVDLLSPLCSPSSLISFTIRNAHSLDIATLLNGKGIALRSGTLCSQPGLARFGKSAVLRISFGVYTSFKEIERFFQALQEVIALI